MYWPNSTICQLILDAWAKVSVSIVVQALTKAEIVTEHLCNSNETNLGDDKRYLSILDIESTQLLTPTLKVKNVMDLWKITAPYNPVRFIVHKIWYTQSD